MFMAMRTSVSHQTSPFGIITITAATSTAVTAVTPELLQAEAGVNFHTVRSFEVNLSGISLK